MDDDLSTLDRCVNDVGRIDGIATWLDVVRDAAGMRAAFVAGVIDDAWVVCALLDDLGLGFQPGSRLTASSLAGLKPWAKPCHWGVERTESRLEVPIVLASGRLFGMLCVLDSISNGLPEPRVVAVVSRIAALIAAQLDLQTRRAQHHTPSPSRGPADGVGESRERFIAVLAHDLKNPLHAVLANGDLLERKLTDPALAAAASRIKTNARRMSSLVDDVLDSARGHLGGGIGLTLSDERNIEAGLNEVVQELQDAQPDRKIVADFQIGRPVRCDIRRLQQLASNLLGNALAHGRATSPITITAMTDHQDLVLQVWNAGEPIPPDYLGRIFEPFWRPGGGNSQTGLGLGLHICAAIVRAHGGRIAVTSTAEQGTEITARFPLGAARPASHDTFPPLDAPARASHANT